MAIFFAKGDDDVLVPIVMPQGTILQGFEDIERFKVTSEDKYRKALLKLPKNTLNIVAVKMDIELPDVGNCGVQKYVDLIIADWLQKNEAAAAS